MQYINYVHDGEGPDDEPSIHTAPVPAEDAKYLKSALQHLQPLTDEQYMTGPAVVLHTMAKFSYVLDGDVLYWCVEWEPGLWIVAMSPDGSLKWVALRSPIPDFGGRDPLPEDDLDYEEDDNPQYNLIFDPWDAQFDEDSREDMSFEPANSEILAKFDTALAHVNSLGPQLEQRFGADARAWQDESIQNMNEWAGEGIRLSS